MSIVRVGLAETKGFSAGYEAIFGGKKHAAAPAARSSKAKTAKKKTAVKKAKKK